jgi:hypothetical protein
MQRRPAGAATDVEQPRCSVEVQQGDEPLQLVNREPAVLAQVFAVYLPPDLRVDVRPEAGVAGLIPVDDVSSIRRVADVRFPPPPLSQVCPNDRSPK